MHSANKLKIIRPEKRTRANSVLDSLPPGHLALKITLNTKVYIHNIINGFKKDHIIPKIDPLYLLFISLVVRFKISLRLMKNVSTRLAKYRTKILRNFNYKILLENYQPQKIDLVFFLILLDLLSIKN